MAKIAADTEPESMGSQTGSRYTVVARRYRPKSFKDLVGQSNVTHALMTAIKTQRIGHAYLFTGARGVGKTSSARIFAKALNAQGGPSSDPDQESDVSRAIDAGEDMDVIEIDGASNRGIDEIRQLRSNVSVRPSRSRYKIYIIDEVHMLTTGAFNALLKTLEEPPEHVKFIFCTTDPEKIPITVLSRCQRFDFAPVQTDDIAGQLQFVCENEGFQADPEALRLIARRANGSMRDSQSLLEQVLSFCDGTITAEKVHAMLGTADETRLMEVVQCIINRNAAAALMCVDRAIHDGIDAGQFAEQLLGFLRDLLTAGVGGPPELMRYVPESGHAKFAEIAKQWGISTVLSAAQMLDSCLVRMRHSVQSRTLLEIVLIQICQLHDLQSVTQLLQAIQGAGPLPTPAPSTGSAHPVIASPATTAALDTSRAPAPAAEEKKNDKPLAQQLASSMAPPTEPATASISAPLTVNETVSREPVETDAPITDQQQSDSALSSGVDAANSQETSDDGDDSGNPDSAKTPLQIWNVAAQRITGLLSSFAKLAVDVEPLSADKWQVTFPATGSNELDYVQRTDRKQALETAVEAVLGRRVQLAFNVRVQEGTESRPAAPPTTSSQRVREAAENPLVKKVCEIFGGEIMRVDAPLPAPTPPKLEQPQSPPTATVDSATANSVPQ